MAEQKIEDFGEKIGGAAKDLITRRGLLMEDIEGMTDIEKRDLVHRDNIWKKMDAIAEVHENGKSRALAYYQNLIRISLPPKPPSYKEDDMQRYISVVTEIRDGVMQATEPGMILVPGRGQIPLKDYVIETFMDSTYYRGYFNVRGRGIITNTLFKVSQMTVAQLTRDAENKGYGMTKEEVARNTVSKRFLIHRYDGVTENPMNEKPGCYFDTKEKCFAVRENYGVTFYHYDINEARFDSLDPSTLEKGKYIIVDTAMHHIGAMNLEQDKAREIVSEITEKEVQEAIEDGKKGADEKGRKKKFVPPQLKSVRQNGGKDYVGDKDITGDDYMERFGFRGGEYGNWLNQTDRQTSLNMGFQALCNLAYALNMDTKDISLGSELAIAFGSRGKGNAMAHYEPARNVINLTKMRGAGCLAHEWGHALDACIGKNAGFVGLGSDIIDNHKIGSYSKQLPKQFLELIQAMRHKVIVEKKDYTEIVGREKKWLLRAIRSSMPHGMTEEKKKQWDTAVEAVLSAPEHWKGDRPEPGIVEKTLALLFDLRKELTGHIIPKDTRKEIQTYLYGYGAAFMEQRQGKDELVTRTVETDFYMGSRAFDKMFSKSGHGYWSSNCEMFARLFDCYVCDKLKDAGIRDDYLTAFCNDYHCADPRNGQGWYAVPIGQEREMLYGKLEEVLTYLHEAEIFHEPAVLPDMEPATEIALEPQTRQEPVSTPVIPGMTEAPKDAVSSVNAIETCILTLQSPRASLYEQLGAIDALKRLCNMAGYENTLRKVTNALDFIDVVRLGDGWQVIGPTGTPCVLDASYPFLQAVESSVALSKSTILAAFEGDRKGQETSIPIANSHSVSVKPEQKQKTHPVGFDR